MANSATSTEPFDIERSSAFDGIPHGFFGSSGGVHQFGFGGEGDPDQIRKLRADAANALVPEGVFLAPHQVHSADVLIVIDAWPDDPEGRPVADALVTNQPGLVIAVVTADCGPILFADHDAGVVGVAHAGWRGAHAGILENTIATMEQIGASRHNISAALGPMIAQESYEVDAAFRENFSPDDAKHFANAPAREGIERWMFDLPGYISKRLKTAGLDQVDDCQLDTYTADKRYFSYRRSTHRGEPNYGRILSAIGVPG